MDLVGAIGAGASEGMRRLGRRWGVEAKGGGMMESERDERERLTDWGCLCARRTATDEHVREVYVED